MFSLASSIGCSKIQIIKILKFSPHRSDGVSGIRMEEGETMVSPFEAPFEFVSVTHGRWGEGDNGRGGKVVISLLASSG